MSVSFPSPTSGQQAEAIAFGSRMEAATEALLRIRNEVVTTLDRQVTELQQIHRALAYAPPPMIVTEDSPRPLFAETAPIQGVVRPSLFEHAPSFPSALPAPAPAGQTTPPRAAPAQFGEVAAAMMNEIPTKFPEATLDPMLEQATLEELNDALASAFAMVSSRAGR